MAREEPPPCRVSRKCFASGVATPGGHLRSATKTGPGSSLRRKRKFRPPCSSSSSSKGRNGVCPSSFPRGREFRRCGLVGGGVPGVGGGDFGDAGHEAFSRLGDSGLALGAYHPGRAGVETLQQPVNRKEGSDSGQERQPQGGQVLFVEADGAVGRGGAGSQPPSARSRACRRLSCTGIAGRCGGEAFHGLCRQGGAIGGTGGKREIIETTGGMIDGLIRR